MPITWGNYNNIIIFLHYMFYMFLHVRSCNYMILHEDYMRIICGLHACAIRMHLLGNFDEITWAQRSSRFVINGGTSLHEKHV
jgi:hypothetical protein